MSTKPGQAHTFHGLRHTFATLALEQGVDVKTIQETLGHHSAAFTMDVCSSVTAKMKKEAADRVDNLLLPW
ncbi:MAG TPA: tyrosine-type recombinase/integrase [Bacillota bacterium]|nr:tyrosine-type recombinase/integrase [Bacillota bacterium]HQD53212.1 tyrosine-type recombinase/integrase [Bacillota bacterium]